jgi:hypothetical protein
MTWTSPEFPLKTTNSCPKAITGLISFFNKLHDSSIEIHAFG